MMMMPWDLFGYFTIRQTYVKLNAAAYIELVKQEPRRIVLMFSFESEPGGIRLCYSSGNPSNPGLFIYDKKAPLKFTNTSDGPLTQVQWTGLSLGGTPGVSILEVMLNKSPCDEQRTDANQLQP